MKTKNSVLLFGLIALVMLPANVWGQTAARLTEIGPNDVRITHMGTDGIAAFDALSPAVAYNTTDNEFLVVWAGDNVVDGAFDIFGQRLDAVTGAALGDPFQISDMGENDAAFDALSPAVAYNTTDNEFLVVWAGDNVVDGAFDIFGQRLDAATGKEVGSNDFEITEGGAVHPAVAYNPHQNEYFVVWQGADAAHPNALEIYGRRLNAATGVNLGFDPIRLSDMGSVDSDAAFDARRPAVTYNTTGEYLVVWEGDDTVDGAFDIFGQRLDAMTAKESGPNDFRLSDMGTADDDIAFGAHRPEVTYNATYDEYLVVWLGDDDTSGLVENEFEIFGQRLNALGEESGLNDFRISAMGTRKDVHFAAAYPDVTFNPTDGDYLVVWRGDHHEGGLVDGEHEIFARRIFGDLNLEEEYTGAGFRLSDMGSVDGKAAFDADHPAVVYGPNNSFFAVWSGDDDTSARNDEHEIYGQLIQAPAVALATFTADVENEDAVQLTWVTAGESDQTLGFEVQHKTTGEFQTLGYVETRATSSEPQQYSYEAQALPPGQHTFRLKQIELDGTYSFSAEVEALLEVPGDFFFASAYPNPFSRSTTVVLTLKKTQNMEVSVYDMLGRRVTTLYRGMIDANQVRTFSFEAASHPSGPYFIRAVGETFVKTQQVLLVR
ncbi:MAG: T9SS type A sorting domain-containing protein [Rhodothermales bacterium]